MTDEQELRKWAITQAREIYQGQGVPAPDDLEKMASAILKFVRTS